MGYVSPSIVKTHAGNQLTQKIARLDIDNVDEIKKEERNFDKLVLPDGYKDIVQALVETHFKKQSHNADLVRGKGKGLIILLHGAPGVGKTSTAETVAEHTGKPRKFPI